MKRKQHNSGDLLFKGNMVIVVNCPVFSMINNRPRELEIVLLHQLKTHVEHKDYTRYFQYLRESVK